MGQDQNSLRVAFLFRKKKPTTPDPRVQEAMKCGACFFFKEDPEGTETKEFHHANNILASWCSSMTLRKSGKDALYTHRCKGHPVSSLHMMLSAVGMRNYQ